MRRQWKALKWDTEVGRDQVQKSPKALWIGSSDFRHTQYALPKMATRFSKPLLSDPTSLICDSNILEKSINGVYSRRAAEKT